MVITSFMGSPFDNTQFASFPGRVPIYKQFLSATRPRSLFLRLRHYAKAQRARPLRVVVNGLVRGDHPRGVPDRFAGVQVARVAGEHLAGYDDAEPMPLLHL